MWQKGHGFDPMVLLDEAVENLFLRLLSVHFVAVHTFHSEIGGPSAGGHDIGVTDSVSVRI